MDDNEEDFPHVETPAGLGPAGEKLFRSIADEYALNAGEIRLLHDAASEADLIADMETQWRAEGAPMTTYGSRNQLVAHPAVSELRQHRTALRALIGSLKLEPYPDDEEEETTYSGRPMTRSESGRKAAHARWARK